MEIKIGDKFAKTVDGECNGDWKVFYKVIKATAKTVTVQREGMYPEVLTRRVKVGFDGLPYILVGHSNCSSADLVR